MGKLSGRMVCKIKRSSIEENEVEEGRKSEAKEGWENEVEEGWKSEAKERRKSGVQGREKSKMGGEVEKTRTWDSEVTTLVQAPPWEMELEYESKEEAMGIRDLPSSDEGWHSREKNRQMKIMTAQLSSVPLAPLDPDHWHGHPGDTTRPL